MGPRPQLFRSGLLHALVEAGNQNVALFIFQFRNDARQRLQRIGGNSAVHAGMQIGHGAAGFEFGVNHAAQADAQRGQLGGKHFRVGDESKIGLQAIRMLAHIFCDGFAAHLFFAFDEQPHVYWKLAVAGLHQRFQGRRLDPQHLKAELTVGTATQPSYVGRRTRLMWTRYFS